MQSDKYKQRLPLPLFLPPHILYMHVFLKPGRRRQTEKATEAKGGRSASPEQKESSALNFWSWICNSFSSSP